MKKTIKSAALVVAMLAGTTAFAQMQDEKNVTITMDLQPILQLDMNTPDHIDFVFDQISEYVGGIVKYGATTLKVSSTVDWDLWAAGTSQGGLLMWDQQAEYGIGTGAQAIVNIPLTALELHQNGPNNHDAGQTTVGRTDYSTAFVSPNFPIIAVPIASANCIYATATPYTAPAVTQKYICGGALTTDFGTGGSYLTTATAPGVSDYYFIIDYRIVPGLPARFPLAGTNALVSNALAVGTYAQPGIYTMDVKYVLMENQ